MFGKFEGFFNVGALLWNQNKARDAANSNLDLTCGCLKIGLFSIQWSKVAAYIDLFRPDSAFTVNYVFQGLLARFFGVENHL